MPRKKYHATCSRCGMSFHSDERSDLLRRLRKHMWAKHEDWMRQRIRAGVRKANKRKQDHMPGNPFLETVQRILNPKWTGFAERPLIERLTGRPYDQVRQEALDAFVSQLFTGML